MSKDRPILMDAESVNGVLADRKTQTRRVVKLRNSLIDGFGRVPYGRKWEDFDFTAAYVDNGPSPAGNPGPYLHVPLPCEGTVHRVYSRWTIGQHLWVRETWGVGTRPHPVEGWYDGIEYRADETYLEGADLLPCHRPNIPDDFDLDKYRGKWRPSIFMPRWASRITRELTDVRVERVQDTTREDIHAEGYQVEQHAMHHEEIWWKRRWDGINGKTYPYSSNPWVWALTFRRAEP